MLLALFADAEICKNIPKYLICRNLACNLAQVVQGGADVDGDQIGGNALLETSFDTFYGFEGFGELVVVAGVRNDGSSL